MEPTERFTNRAGNYAKFRPSYPEALLQFMHQHFGLNDATTIADIGSGTGILTELLLEQGYEVMAIEPNAAMRKTAEHQLSGYKKFHSISGTGEQTTLPNRSVSLITAAQAFHWLDPVKAKAEFNRILKPKGHIAILWNLITTQSAFGKAYEALKEKYGADYLAIRKSHEPDLKDFFDPTPLKTIFFPYNMFLDLEGLTGLILSSSFMPLPADPLYPAMINELESIFNTYQENGLVNMEYQTKLYYNEQQL